MSALICKARDEAYLTESAYRHLRIGFVLVYLQAAKPGQVEAEQSPCTWL